MDFVIGLLLLGIGIFVLFARFKTKTERKIGVYYNDKGKPLAGGKLYFKQVNTDVDKNTYSDAALCTLNKNPVILDSDGRSPVDIFLNGKYAIKIADADDNLVYGKEIEDSRK